MLYFEYIWKSLMRIITLSLSTSAFLILQRSLHFAIVIVNAIGCHLMCIVDCLILPYDEFIELNHKHLRQLISMLTLHLIAHTACNKNSNFRNTLNKTANTFPFPFAVRMYVWCVHHNLQIVLSLYQWLMPKFD